MIRTVKPEEAAEVFELLGKVYSNHSFLGQGVEAYIDQLQEGSYVSLGEFDGPNLRAHAGYSTIGNSALISSLVVDPEHRGVGLGKKVFNARLAHIMDRDAFDYVAGFSMAQHLKSQQLYDDEFKPIGLVIGYPDIYRGRDAAHNKGNKSNAELVLCRRLSGRSIASRVEVPSDSQLAAKKILESIDVVVEYADDVSNDEHSDDIFLGFHPNLATGLFTPAYLDTRVSVDFEPIVTSNNERNNFVKTIRKQYERKA